MEIFIDVLLFVECMDHIAKSLRSIRGQEVDFVTNGHFLDPPDPAESQFVARAVAPWVIDSTTVRLPTVIAHHGEIQRNINVIVAS